MRGLGGEKWGGGGREKRRWERGGRKAEGGSKDGRIKEERKDERDINREKHALVHVLLQRIQTPCTLKIPISFSLY